MKRIGIYALLIMVTNLLHTETFSQGSKLRLDFEDDTKSREYDLVGDGFSYEKGIDGHCLSICPTGNDFNHLVVKNLPFTEKTSFTVQFWVRSESTKPTVLISQKEFLNKGISSQKNKGWALYSSGGTIGWSVGSGKRRLNYERDNGDKLPLSDGLWHQVTMTYDDILSEVRLYFDGENIAIYKLSFDFFSNTPIVVGSKEYDFDYENEVLTEIKKGQEKLQELVCEFNKLKVGEVAEDEFFSLIVDPKELYLGKLNVDEAERSSLREKKLAILEKVNSIHRSLYYNPYTVSQNHELTALKPVSKIYYLQNGKVCINDFYAKQFGREEQFYPSDFSMDMLTFYQQALSPKAIRDNYSKYRKTKSKTVAEKIDTLTVAVWNIWHGGTHFTQKKDGWDSRLRIVELLKKYNADIVLMQETYSSGDFIAAELGYYFATTSDWDYCSQGSNISVLSRYPIKKLEVLEKTEFMNVSVKISLSETQKIYAMSNWYGMSSFPKVYEFHEEKFNDANNTPILFGGDFNAIPHTDGGDNKASVKLLNNGFEDAFRSLHKDVETFPGFTHQWGERIDQLYYKGKGLSIISSEVISTAFGGFPSDHFMILSKFELNY